MDRIERGCIRVTERVKNRREGGSGGAADPRRGGSQQGKDAVASGGPVGNPEPAAPPENPIDAARRRAIGNPDDPVARLDLADLYRERGDLLLALEQLESARNTAPENVDVLVRLGTVLGLLGRSTEAEKELRRAQRLDAQRPDVHNQLGLVLFKRGLYRQAEVELQRAIELDDRNADAYFYRGEALNQLGRVDDALEMLERAVQFQPSNAKAYYTMGILYDRKHLRQEATTMYRKAREIGAA